MPSQDHDMVDALAADRSDQSFGAGVETAGGEPMLSTTAPKVIKRPAARRLTSSPSANSLSLPAGARMQQPVTKFPSRKSGWSEVAGICEDS